MSEWSKSSALAELQSLIKEIDPLFKKGRNSTEHSRWVMKVLVFLEEVFGRDSRYYLAFASYTWAGSGNFVFGGPGDPEGSMDPRMAVKRHHHEAYLEHLESAKGLLLAAMDHLNRVKNIGSVYQGKDTAPEASAILRIIDLAEQKLRKTIREKPSGEIEIQDAFENLLIGANIAYKREKDRFDYSSKTYIPDFTFPKLELALDFKFCGNENVERRLIKEINDYIVAFRTQYSNLIFIVYDLGFIRDVELFTNSLEQNQNVLVCVVKH